MWLEPSHNKNLIQFLGEMINYMFEGLMHN